MDDLARWYVDAGIVEDLDDITSCPKCAASVTPWQIECPGCGFSGSVAPKEPWTCGLCGEDYEEREDAEMCCLPQCACCHQYFETQQGADECCGLPEHFVHLRRADETQTICGLPLWKYEWQFDGAFDVECDDDAAAQIFCHFCIGEDGETQHF